MALRVLRSQRWIQHAALASRPPPTHHHPSIVRPLPRVNSELSRRVDALSRVAEQEVLNVSHWESFLTLSSQETPPNLIYREEELLQLYEDLLALPDEPKVTPRVSTEKRDSAVVEAILPRLPSAPEQSEPQTATLPHHVVLNLLAPVVQQLSTIQAPNVPLALLSMQEWRSLTRVCVSTIMR